MSSNYKPETVYARAKPLVLIPNKFTHNSLRKLTSKFSEAAYINSDIHFLEDKVVASRNIPRGTTLLIEHVLHLRSAQDCYDVISHNRDLFESLQPKKAEWLDPSQRDNTNSIDKFFEGVSYKFQKNVLCGDTKEEGDFAVIKGKFYARFNSSPKFNINIGFNKTQIEWSKYQTTKFAIFLIVYAYRDIAAGEELTTYSPLRKEDDDSVMRKFYSPFFNGNDPMDCLLAKKASELASKAINKYALIDVYEVLYNVDMAWNNIISNGEAVYYLQNTENYTNKVNKLPVQAEPSFVQKAELMWENLVADIRGKKTLKIPMLL